MANPTGTRVLEAALLLAGLGFLESRWSVLVWLEGQDPLVLFALWYVLFYIFLQVASVVLFRSFGVTSLRVGLGLVILWFAVGIVAYWPLSLYVEHATGIVIPNLALATEDQLTATFWYSLVGVTDNVTLGLLTYSITPAVLIILGAGVLGYRRTDAAFRELFTPASASGPRRRVARAWAALSSPGMHHERPVEEA